MFNKDLLDEDDMIKLSPSTDEITLKPTNKRQKTEKDVKNQKQRDARQKLNHFSSFFKVSFLTFSKLNIKQLVSQSNQLVSEISIKSLYQAFGSIKTTHCQYSQVIVQFLVMPCCNDWTNNSRWIACNQQQVQ
ncbi:Hypothetical_protein [Hexamita inflata]|uniref:Hypothetical_protein n=1 Tax=Hexamita inflata TaxID=28002 RepID=A0AA86PHF2_9EUKA|nr:Hypothetical protein HINF_LOCUS26263 [Hexamita inflata]